MQFVKTQKFKQTRYCLLEKPVCNILMLGNCPTDNGCHIISSNDRMQQPQTQTKCRQSGNFEI